MEKSVNLINKLNEIYSMAEKEKEENEIDHLLIFNAFSKKLSYFLCENLDSSKIYINLF